MKLNNHEKMNVIRTIIRISSKEPQITFTAENYKNIFGDIDFNGLVDFLGRMTRNHNFIFLINNNKPKEYTVSMINRRFLRAELRQFHKEEIFIFRKERVWMVIAFIMVISLTIMSVHFLKSPFNQLTQILTIFIGAIIVICISLISLNIRRVDENKEVRNYSKRLQKTLNDLNNNKDESSSKGASSENDALKLMLVNMEEIKAYYTLSKNHARNSFVLAVCMCIFGFLLISVSVVIPFFTGGTYTLSIIPAASGAVVEVVAGTTLVVYKNSLKQLNHYYKSLHENEKFLSTVNLVRKLSPDKQDEAYLDIIHNNLKSLQESELSNGSETL